MVQYVWSEQVDSILGAGESLEVLGVRNWALDQAGALDALERLHHEGIAVAGGDVYRLENGRLEPTYDNWYCDRSDDESIDEYIERSIDIARSYISECPNSDGETLFSLVPVAW
ncbi:Imm40 family immunity protein [Stenotrophomonas sp. LGBM10]|uniref:Imm40 family immunity protein n=1 Tax=Stenotrophomonas sp. LGBM10 TaxID=3390038 RepID=UPI00398B774C